MAAQSGTYFSVLACWGEPRAAWTPEGEGGRGGREGKGA